HRPAARRPLRPRGPNREDHGRDPRDVSDRPEVHADRGVPGLGPRPARRTVLVTLAASIHVRKTAVTVETIHHEGGPVAERPVRIAAALAVVRNPFAGRYEPDLLGFQTDLRTLGIQLATEL